jgi:hypothetical protein
MIQDLINALSNHNLKVEFIKWDEVIYSYDNVNQIKFLEEIDSDLFRVKLFSVKLVEDFRIHTYYDFSDNEIDSEIVGCNGHKYFILLKKWILNEPLDIRDLYFRNDGDLAIWNIDGLKISL